MRAFVAIDLPDEVRSVLEDVQDDVPVGRLMTPETLHLTLAFLGEQPRDLLAAVDEELARIRAASFEVQLHGLGTFGNRRPSVLWAGVKPQPALGALRERVRGAVRRAGLELPRERFRPHVTLARFSARVGAEELERLRRFLERFGDVGLPGFEVKKVTLFHSRWLSDGAVHDVLEEYPLTTGRDAPGVRPSR